MISNKENRNPFMAALGVKVEAQKRLQEQINQIQTQQRFKILNTGKQPLQEWESDSEEQSHDDLHLGAQPHYDSPEQLYGLKSRKMKLESSVKKISSKVSSLVKKIGLSGKKLKNIKETYFTPKKFNMEQFDEVPNMDTQQNEA